MINVYSKGVNFGFQSSLDFCVYGGDLDMQVAVAKVVHNDSMSGTFVIILHVL